LDSWVAIKLSKTSTTSTELWNWVRKISCPMARSKTSRRLERLKRRRKKSF